LVRVGGAVYFWKQLLSKVVKEMRFLLLRNASLSFVSKGTATNYYFMTPLSSYAPTLGGLRRRSTARVVRDQACAMAGVPKLPRTS